MTLSSPVPDIRHPANTEVKHADEYTYEGCLVVVVNMMCTPSDLGIGATPMLHLRPMTADAVEGRTMPDIYRGARSAEEVPGYSRSPIGNPTRHETSCAVKLYKFGKVLWKYASIPPV